MSFDLEWRNQKIAELEDRLRASIARVADDAVRRWVRVHPAGLNLVADAELAFLLATATWVQSDDGADLEPIADAFDRVVDAWRCATAAYYRREAHR